MKMYFPYFMAYILIGLTLGLLVFVWAMKNGQFRDQQRARFLPLEEDHRPAQTRPGKTRRWEIYGLIILAVAGLAASAAVLVVALLTDGS
jgi:cbb3-type cytochrome oxidase maturation protein